MCIRQRREGVSPTLIGDIEEVELKIPAILRLKPSGLRASGYNLRPCATSGCPYHANPGDVFCGVCRRELEPPVERTVEERINDGIGRAMILLVIVGALLLILRHGVGPRMGWWQ